MPIFKELVLAGPALVLFLFVSDAFLGPDENERIKDTIASDSRGVGADLVPVERWLAKDSIAGGSPWIGADSVPAERWLAKDSITTGGSWLADLNPEDRRFASELTPAARVRKAFGQFATSESGRAI